MASASRHCSLLNSVSPSFLTASMSVVSELHPRARIEDANSAQIVFIESPCVILGVMPRSMIREVFRRLCALAHRCARIPGANILQLILQGIGGNFCVIGCLSP